MTFRTYRSYRIAVQSSKEYLVENIGAVFTSLRDAKKAIDETIEQKIASHF